MKKESMLNLLSILLAVSGFLFIIWWVLIGVTQMISGSGSSLSQIVQTSGWIPINIIGLIAVLLLILGLTRILFEDSTNIGVLGFLGVIICILGTALFASLQFDETFVWPLLATHAGSMLEIRGPMFTDPGFFASYIVMGILFTLGFIFIAVQSLRRAIFPKIPSILMIIGAPLFGGGLYVPIIARTIGLILLGVSFIWAGFSKIKKLD